MFVMCQSNTAISLFLLFASFLIDFFGKADNTERRRYSEKNHLSTGSLPNWRQQLKLSHPKPGARSFFKALGQLQL